MRGRSGVQRTERERRKEKKEKRKGQGRGIKRVAARGGRKDWE